MTGPLVGFDLFNGRLVIRRAVPGLRFLRGANLLPTLFQRRVFSGRPAAVVVLEPQELMGTVHARPSRHFPMRFAPVAVLLAV